MEAISVLKKDHRMVEELFKKFEQAGDRAFKTKRRLVDEIITELSVHAAIEEQVFYPATREAREENEEMVLEALEEHHLVKLALSELEKMDPADERFTAKVTVLIENVRHHVKEEEGQMFPKVRKAMKPDDLARLGEELEEAKESAPTRPHPAAPDQPPGNVVAGSMAAVMDAGKDAVRGVKEEIRRRRG
ncbi:MAG TPA: hemerythrin domain-containing protein [Actinomycetota bacterium]